MKRNIRDVELLIVRLVMGNFLKDVQSLLLGEVLQHVKKLSLKSKSVAPGAIELNYEVRLREEDSSFINELALLDGVTHTVLVSYNGDYMG